MPKVKYSSGAGFIGCFSTIVTLFIVAAVVGYGLKIGLGL